MDAALKQEKEARLQAALDKLGELQRAEPAGDAVAHSRAAANHLTVTFGISRPLSDRYVAEAKQLGLSAASQRAEQIAAALARVTDLDARFGAAFMVLPNHVAQILRGGKQMSRRFRRWGDPGDVFRVQDKAFRFTRVERLKVSDISEDDVRKEGYQTRAEFEQMWVHAHPRSVAAGKTLNHDGWCWCHEYEPV